MLSKHSQQKAYEEACSFIRHYSTASLTVRLASVVQGFALLGGWVVAVTEKNELLMLLLPAIGLLFTGLLLQFHKGYFLATGHFLDLASEMEKRMFQVAFRPALAFRQIHERRFGRKPVRAFTVNAPFVIVGIAFVVALIYSLLFVWYSVQVAQAGANEAVAVWNNSLTPVCT